MTRSRSRVQAVPTVPPIEVQPVAAQEGKRQWFSYREAEAFSERSRTTLWKQLGAKEIKATRIGRAVRITKPPLENFMEGADVV